MSSLAICYSSAFLVLRLLPFCFPIGARLCYFFDSLTVAYPPYVREIRSNQSFISQGRGTNLN